MAIIVGICPPQKEAKEGRIALFKQILCFQTVVNTLVGCVIVFERAQMNNWRESHSGYREMVLVELCCIIL